MTDPFEPPAETIDQSRGVLDHFVWVLFSVQGRIPRLSYWVGTIFSTIAAYFLLFVVGLVFVDSDIGLVFEVLVSVAFFWVGLALQVKRWHDRGKSGLWYFINFVPISGVVLAFFTLGEPVTPSLLVGTILVSSGVYLTNSASFGWRLQRSLS